MCLLLGISLLMSMFVVSAYECVDSDVNSQFPDGKNYWTQGKASLQVSETRIRSYKDSCKDYSTDFFGDFENNIGPGGGPVVYGRTTPYLYEAVCGRDGNPTVVLKECNCLDGVCVHCVDSDVNSQFPDGKNYWQQGRITIGNQFWKDCCVETETSSACRYGETTPYLAEVFCEGDSHSSERYKCLEGCKDGKCLGVPKPPTPKPVIENLIANILQKIIDWWKRLW